MRDWRNVARDIAGRARASLAQCLQHRRSRALRRPCQLQLQWAPQAQFAGYFAADREGYYAAEG